MSKTPAAYALLDLYWDTHAQELATRGSGQRPEFGWTYLGQCSADLELALSGSGWQPPLRPSA